MSEEIIRSEINELLAAAKTATDVATLHRLAQIKSVLGSIVSDKKHARDMSPLEYKAAKAALTRGRR